MILDVDYPRGQSTSFFVTYQLITSFGRQRPSSKVEVRRTGGQVCNDVEAIPL